MTPLELLAGLYDWADANALYLLIGAVGLPLTMVALAWLAHQLANSNYGERIANSLTISAIAFCLLAVLLSMFAQWGFKASLWQANILLLLAPPAYLLTSFLGVHLLFPLNQLASIRALKDIGWFLGACLLVLWLFSKFRGWGVLFFGGTLQLLLIGLGLFWLLRRLYRQASGQKRGY